MFRTPTLPLHTARNLFGLLVISLLAVASAGCSNGGSSGGGVAVGPVPFTAISELEPNDQPDQALMIAPGQFVHGDLDVPADVDQWTFFATAGQVVRIETRARIFDQEGWDDLCNYLNVELANEAGETIFNSGRPNGGVDPEMPAVMINESGEHRIILSNFDPLSDGGRYALRFVVLEVNGFQMEQETWMASGENDTVLDAEPIVPGTLWGYYVTDELDHYRFTVTEPTVVELEMVAHRNGRFGLEAGSYDSYLRILDSNGAVLVARDDAYHFDSGLRLAITQPGEYIIQVDEWANNADSGEYLLSFSADTLPDLTDEAGSDSFSARPVMIGEIVRENLAANGMKYFVIEGLAGDRLIVDSWSANRYQGAPSGVVFTLFAPDTVTAVPFTASAWGLRALLLEDGPYYLQVSSPNAVDSEFALRPEVTHESGLEIEPNDTPDEASTVVRGSGVTGRIESATDVDQFRFEALPAELVNFEVFALQAGTMSSFLLHGTGSTLLPILTVRDSNGNVVASLDTASAPCGSGRPRRTSNKLATYELAFLAAGGLYTLEIEDPNSSGDSSETYLVVWVAGP